MEKLLLQQASAAALSISAFLSEAQSAAMLMACRGEEGEYFAQKFVEIAQRIEGMPATYASGDLGNLSIVQLHYFLQGSDWYIIEKDIEGGVVQAWGWAILNGDLDFAETGYISISDIVSMGGELDLHFVPCTLADLKAQKGVR